MGTYESSGQNGFPVSFTPNGTLRNHFEWYANFAMRPTTMNTQHPARGHVTDFRYRRQESGPFVRSEGDFCVNAFVD